jgi:transcription elongation factor Elf1
MTDNHSSAATTAPLLPCPFCGEKRVSLNDPHPDGYRYGSINCPACLVVMPGEVASQQELIDCWNTRPVDAAQTGEVLEALRAAKDYAEADFEDTSDLPAKVRASKLCDKVDAALAILAAQPSAAPVSHSSAGNDAPLEDRVMNAISEWVGETDADHIRCAAKEAIALVLNEPQAPSNREGGK